MGLRAMLIIGQLTEHVIAQTGKCLTKKITKGKVIQPESGRQTCLHLVLSNSMLLSIDFDKMQQIGLG